METIGKIRRRRLVQGESISSIARELGVSRNTVKRALKVEGDAYEYRRTRQPMPKLGPFMALLNTLDYDPRIGVVLATVRGSAARYELRGDELYVRARVVSTKRHPNPYRAGDVEMAWTQPIVGTAQ